jgi:hypothetical protein
MVRLLVKAGVHVTTRGIFKYPDTFGYPETLAHARPTKNTALQNKTSSQIKLELPGSSLRNV